MAVYVTGDVHGRAEYGASVFRQEDLSKKSIGN